VSGTTLADTSRNGLGRTVSPFRIRIFPGCSRMNDRPATVGEATSPTGASRPSASGWRPIETGSIAGVGSGVSVGLVDLAGATDDDGLAGGPGDVGAESAGVSLGDGPVEPQAARRTRSAAAAPGRRR
jgi:hypothetical protein